jgi:hypothetical protein
MENLRLLVGTSSQICAEERYKRILVDTALWLFDGDWRSNPGALETFASQAADRAVRQARTHAAGPQDLQKNSQAAAVAGGSIARSKACRAPSEA